MASPTPISFNIDPAKFMRALAVKEGRKGRKGLKIGICGEHGGDPQSVVFFHGCGLDYVSCSPYRVPVARLAAAHARLAEEGGAGSGTA